jgi:alkanesulfonate monooxygenase SsuD/methylene tetrahydromethanopterin reductase-like flavin-dependent oxidoreductase (luciferase family)
MHYAVSIPNVGWSSSARRLARVAADAEAAGWDGVFVWDHLLLERRTPLPVGDVWILLAAIAVSTRRIRLGPMVCALSRRLPWEVARQSATLDELAGGRVVLGVGLGNPPDADFEPFGIPADVATRAERFDEAVEIVARLWRGEETAFSGRHFQLDAVTFLPPARRIPLWAGFGWPGAAPLRRAARLDGAYPLHRSADGFRVLTCAEFRETREALATAREELGLDGRFDLVAGGSGVGAAPAERVEVAESFRDAGATWWVEALGQADEVVVRERVADGPPRDGGGPAP